MHDDLVGRDFTADAPNTLWLGDITEHRTGEGKLYLVRSRMCSPAKSSATASTHGRSHGWRPRRRPVLSRGAVMWWPAASFTRTEGRKADSTGGRNTS